jgi:hypothetical protein
MLYYPLTSCTIFMLLLLAAQFILLALFFCEGYFLYCFYFKKIQLKKLIFTRLRLTLFFFFNSHNQPA